MTSETVYNGRDNVAEWLLISDDVVVSDLTSVTEMKLFVNDVEYNSATLGNSLFWWTDEKEYEGSTVNVIKMKLGKFGLTANKYDNCRLRVYDPVNVDGITWVDDVFLDVVDTDLT